MSVEIADREAEDGVKDIIIKDIAQYTTHIISTLPERQRLAIQMRDVEGYELEEIAEVLECDQTSVRMNLSRARKSIREQILKAMNYGTE
jgi:RNA polymerase sigma-70 factor (ECF subfamily)